MTFKTRQGRDLGRGVAIACVLALAAAVVLWYVLTDSGSKRITAYFGAAVGLYEGNDVRVLGVAVGTVDKVEPQGDQVKVELLVDRDRAIPLDASAVVVAPSLVSDRYVQLAPAYVAGPQMNSGATIPRQRTATPLEVDELYKSLNRVSTTLGPNGANKDGALSDLLDTLAKNLEGNGQATHDTIKQLGQAARTLSGSQEQLFSTVDNLNRFTGTLAASDQQVRQFSQQLADVSKFLAAERTNLAQAVQQLSTALEQVQAFIRDNRDRLKSNVDKLASVTKVLVDQRAALAEVLDVAPLALSNVYNTYNAASGTLDARANLNELTQPPIVMICKLLEQGTPKDIPTLLSDACKAAAPLVKGIPSVPQVLNAYSNGFVPQFPVPLGGGR
ncbi:MCE family protein [Kibdelosporangium persicum]|uniref:ABC transport system substrate-binding protein n=1 Tax=Kibdelosporangium persicum TaxID=2698649 RepID=A0ABX2FG24_9PSEU|nr:MCE family protein [Kibdelosporangium persicum]NRN69718.1 ABC transport system substrate-binding protein [Kibdelosporangium persicum]